MYVQQSVYFVVFINVIALVLRTENNQQNKWETCTVLTGQCLLILIMHVCSVLRKGQPKADQHPVSWCCHCCG